MLKYTDRNYALYPKTGGGRNFKEEEKEFEGRMHKSIDGIVETPYGFVKVYANSSGGSFEFSSLDMIKDGRIYYRRFQKFLTRKTLVTKAKQFANELYG